VLPFQDKLILAATLAVTLSSGEDPTDACRKAVDLVIEHGKEAVDHIDSTMDSVTCDASTVYDIARRFAELQASGTPLGSAGQYVNQEHMERTADVVHSFCSGVAACDRGRDWPSIMTGAELSKLMDESCESDEVRATGGQAIMKLEPLWTAMFPDKIWLPQSFFPQGSAGYEMFGSTKRTRDQHDDAVSGEDVEMQVGSSTHKRVRLKPRRQRQ
jgi:hypothetical protein